MAFGPLTYEELVELWRTLFPAGYTAPVEEEADGQGFDLTAQQARQFARAAEAVARTSQTFYLLPHSTQVYDPASGGVRATATVEVTREAPAHEEMVIVEGVELATELRGPSGAVDGPRYRFTADVTIPAGSLGPVSATVESVRPYYGANQPGDRLAGFASRGTAEITVTVGASNVVTDDGSPDQFHEGQVGQFVRFVSGVNAGEVRRIVSVTIGSGSHSAVLAGSTLTAGAAELEVLEYADAGLSVEATSDFTGGRDPWLDTIGEERKVYRVEGQSDADYRKRVAALSDVVSPASILRILARTLSPLGIGYALHETRDPATLKGFVYDDSAYDRSTGLSSFGGEVMVSLKGSVRFFVVRIGGSGLGDFGGPYDSPYPGGNALDLMAYDGYPLGYFALVASLYDDIERAREAGVAWVLLYDPTL